MLSKNNLTVILGTGGVGKTTVSCVMALDYALKGSKVLLITIDPSKRLKDTLFSVFNPDFVEPIKIDIGTLTDIKPQGSGELFAFIPDLKKEWLNFLTSSLSNQENIEKISSNPFYGYLVEGIAGSHEIISCYILHRFFNDTYDYIVLDTPPSSQSMAFLNAPKKIVQLLEQDIFKTLLLGQHFLKFREYGRKLAFFSATLLEKTIEKLIGSHFLSELLAFFSSLDLLYEPLLKKAQEMSAILAFDKTNFVLVLTPKSACLKDVLNHESSSKTMRIDSLVFNQVLFNAEKENLTKEVAELKLQNWKLLDLYQKEKQAQESVIARIKQVFEQVKTYTLFTNQIETHNQALFNELIKNWRK